MKKNRTCAIPFGFNKFLEKLFLAFLFLSVPAIGPAQTKQADKKVTITFTAKETLDGALKKLEKASGLIMAFDPSDAVNISVKQKKFTAENLYNILDFLLKDQGFSYNNRGTSITIFKTPGIPKNPNVPAGGGPGSIKGRIVEFETSQPVPGASVYIVELKQGGQSDKYGYYKFTGIPAGKYTLQVSYIGYSTEKMQVEVNEGKTETYDVKMQGNNQLGEVVVTAVGKSRRPVAHTSEKQVLEEVKQATIVVSAISSEQISKSADRNAAEAVQKVAGVSLSDDKFLIIRGLNPRYNLTYLNDNVAPSTEIYSRAFALDLIPSRIIDRIMVYKSAGPETLADATGGVVKIYTKDAKSVKHFDMELQLGYRPGTTFNKNFLTYKGGKWDWLGFDDGTRKLPSSVPGYDQLARAQLSPSEYARTFNPTLTNQVMTALPNLQLTANYYNAFQIWGRTISSLTSFSYKNEALKLNIHREDGYPEMAFQTSDKISDENRNTQTAQLNLLQNFTLKLRDSSYLSFKNFVLQQGVNAAIVRHSQAADIDLFATRANKDHILSFNQRFLYAGNLGGMHYWNKGTDKLQWNVGYTFSRQGTPDQRVIRFTAPTRLAAIGDTTLQWRARGQNLEFTDSFDPIPSTLGMISRLWMRNSEGNYNASIDYTYRLNSLLSIRVGTFQQWKQRQLYRRIYTVNEGDVDNPDDIFFQPGTGHYIDPMLVRFREQDVANVWSETYLRDDYVGLRVHDRTSGTDSYIGTEQNNSGYFALHFTPLGRKFEIYGGLRYEYNRQKIGAAIPKPAVNPSDINTPIYINNPMSTWLPSVNASWRPNGSWVIRGAYSKTVNRTEFREVAPYKELDFENNVVISGNAALKSATVNNCDFRVEFYPGNNKKGELISLGLFYKALKNPIERINTSSRALNDFPSISYQNATSATIKGLEIELNKKLDFVPGKLFRDLSFIGNLTLIRSATKSDTLALAELSLKPDDKRKLQGQAPYLINAGLYYDNAAWGTRVAAIFTARGESIYAAGRGNKYNSYIHGPEYRGSLIELARHTLDLSITQRIVNSLQAKFSIQNLLNQPIRIAEDFNFSNKYEPLTATGELDERGRKRMDGDNISSSYKPGRYFILNISYSF